MKFERDFTDYLIMLLSTDWFQPYWVEIGITICDSKRVGIQQGCRDIVAQILDGSDNYFLCDFSKERREETASRFVTLVGKWEAEEEVIGTWKEWACLSNDTLTAAVVFGLIVREVPPSEANRGMPDLLHEVRAELKKWDAYAAEANRLRDTCLNSRTEWDLRTQHFLLHPDVLANTLWKVLLDRELRVFWAELRARLMPEQIQQLVSWYREMLRITPWAGPDLFPSYMR